jgi:Tol biopolymer transport system component/DNA-binding winged helix-turn-helix (wHTH) protein
MAEAPLPASPRIVRFSVFELDRRTGELRKAGIKLGLQDQPLHVLTMLLESPGELVTREELKHRLWPDHTFVDFEQGLNAAVKRLRTALGDSADTPRFIETLPRRGYRFIGPVEGGATSAALTGSGTRARRVIAVALAMALGVGAVIIGWRFRWPPTAQAPRVIPLTSFAGWETDPALSPDGNQVAFQWDGGRLGDPAQIYLRLVDGGNLLKLTSESGGAWTPAWSPDGRQIAYLTHAPDRTHDVVVIPALGASPRKIGTTAAMAHGLSWSLDGKLLAIVDKEPTEKPEHIALLSVADGTKTRATFPPASDDGDSDPRFSPDGRRLAFVRRPLLGAVADVYVVTLGEREPARVTSDKTNVIGLDWTGDGNELIFSSSRTGSMGRWSLWRVPAAGGTPRGVEIAGDFAVGPSVARRGDRLIYTRWQIDWDIWRVGGPAALPEERRALPLIASTRWDFKPQYSPDGRKIAFVSQRSGAHELWVCDKDGANPVQLTFLDSPRAYGSEWSPDGRDLAFASNVPGNYEIFVVSAAGGPPRRVTRDAFEKALPSWSHDGFWIYFTSARSGSNEVWKVPSAGGDIVQVTTHGGTKTYESIDGRYLYFAKRMGGKGPVGIWRMPVVGGEEEKVSERGGGDGWAVHDEGLCYIDESSREHPGIACLDFASGKSGPLIELPMAPLPYGLSISPDRKSILYVHKPQDDQDLVRVEGFR